MQQENIFDENVYNTATLKVPKGSLSLYYVASGWMLFDNIVEDNEVLFGDVSGDGTVNVSDANLVVSEILTQGNNLAYDVNGDGTVNVTDVNLIVSAILMN